MGAGHKSETLRHCFGFRVEKKVYHHPRAVLDWVYGSDYEQVYKHIFSKHHKSTLHHTLPNGELFPPPGMMPSFHQIIQGPQMILTLIIVQVDLMPFRSLATHRQKRSHRHSKFIWVLRRLGKGFLFASLRSTE